MNPYIALTRPGNAILTAIAVIAGAFIASGWILLNLRPKLQFVVSLQ